MSESWDVAYNPGTEDDVGGRAVATPIESGREGKVQTFCLDKGAL